MGSQKSSLDNFDVRARFRDHIFGCFIDDVHGIANLATIGEDNVMIETDYPHTDSTWPDCIDLAHKRLAHLAPEVQYKILRGNAERLFNFQPAEPPALP
jgi:predicted TIM-barrel fold metal-dependent hydrolase